MSVAQRMAKMRARRRRDRACVLVEVDPAALEDALVEADLLSLTDADDPRKIEAAASEAMAQWIGGVTRNALPDADMPD